MGTLIVFEGTDGSGKATQTAMLCAALEKKGIFIGTHVMRCAGIADAAS